jgi:hypothetical protein
LLAGGPCHSIKGGKLTKVLGHGVGLEGKGVELVGVEGKLLLDVLERVVVDEEEDLLVTC